MGSVTAPERAKDTIDMAKIIFGEDFVKENTVMISLINANSPMTWDGTCWVLSKNTYVQTKRL